MSTPNSMQALVVAVVASIGTAACGPAGPYKPDASAARAAETAVRPGEPVTRNDPGSRTQPIRPRISIDAAWTRVISDRSFRFLPTLSERVRSRVTTCKVPSAREIPSLQSSARQPIASDGADQVATPHESKELRKILIRS